MLVLAWQVPTWPIGLLLGVMEPQDAFLQGQPPLGLIWSVSLCQNENKFLLHWSGPFQGQDDLLKGGQSLLDIQREREPQAVPGSLDPSLWF